MDDWSIQQHKLVKEFRFSSFVQAIDFINNIAKIADALDHHPEIYNYYNKVIIYLHTKDNNSITAKDYLLAEKIDEL